MTRHVGARLLLKSWHVVRPSVPHVVSAITKVVRKVLAFPDNYSNYFLSYFHISSARLLLISLEYLYEHEKFDF